VSAASSSATARRPYVEFAVGLSLGVAIAALAVIPAAIRSSSQGVSFALAWLSLWGSAAAMLAPAIGALRVARPIPFGALSIPAGLVLAAPILIVLGRVLKSTTHHRPLGAATFAMLAAVVVLGAIAIAARLIGPAVRTGRWQRMARSILAVLLGTAMLATIALALPLARTELGSVLDAVLALGLSLVAFRAKLPAALQGAARIAGPVAFVVVVAGGIAVRSGGVRAATGASAPVLAGPFR
jgi:hypothetical protein